ncbi:microtubule-associated protein tau isoform X2 [Andrena cerasifolii]|uniref:microtubule-associated protein tau isoform X2 n=1 Tax=Andrena cerasifolii TaxID=2819439 RepID=UPI004037ADB9
MDSQEATSNAVESAPGRGRNVVKANPPLPPGFRARPQGPPGSPRHPINNGPIGQSRPGGQPQQIRFDGRTAFGPSSSGQFVQLRPYGPPRPPGSTLPQKPPQQGQNTPILNTRFAPPPPNKINPQLRPRLPGPVNYQVQQFQRSVQQPQQPRPEHQNIPQEARNPEFLGRQQGTAQHQLQRNESLLNTPQQSSSSTKEDKRSPLPRIVVERMADVDNTKKPQQFENPVTKEKMRESAENDDDDDVVIDGKKSPRPGSNISSQDGSIQSKSPNKENIAQSLKRPETATLNGKMDTKDDNTAVGKVNEKSNDSTTSDKVDKLESKTEEPVKGTSSIDADNRLSSAKLNEKAHAEASDRGAVEKVDNKLAGPVEGTVQGKHIGDKVDLIKDCTVEPSMSKNTSSSSGPTIAESKLGESDTSDTSVPLSKDLSHEQSLKTIGESQKKAQPDTPIEGNKKQNEQDSKAVPKSAEKSRGSTPAEIHDNEGERELETTSKSSGDTQVTAPAEVSQAQEEVKMPSKSPEKVQASRPTETNQTKVDEESQVPSKFSDTSHASTPAESNRQDGVEGKIREQSSAAMDQNQGEQESKATSKLAEKSHEITPVEINQTQVKTTSIQEKQDLKPEPKELNKSCTSMPAEMESKAPSQHSEKLPELENSLTVSSNNQPLIEESTKTPESISIDSVATKASEENIHHDKPVQDSVDANIISRSEDSPALVTTAKSPRAPEPPKSQEKLSAAESMLSPPKSPKETVKGFDNGQRKSLSSKSSPSCSPRSPVSPTSPTRRVKLENEKKNATSVQNSTDESESDGKKAAGAKTLSKPSAPKIERAPTPAKLDEKSQAKFSATSEIENGNATYDTAQFDTMPTTNGVSDLPTKKSPSKSKDADKRSAAGSPVKSPSKSVKSLPRTPETPSSTTVQEKKKLPMNKIQVGAAPSPNLKTVRSKIGSLDNASYKPGGGKVKIENRKLDFSKAQPKIAAKNEKYTPSGGDKKIAQVKLQWNAKPKVGSLDNATYKPGGGDKKIETVKLDFKDKAKPKVGSKDNAKHVPGGGSVKIQVLKVDVKAESKIGSLDNVKHKPGGGDKKIFNDRDYLRQTGSNVESLSGSGSQIKIIDEMKSLSTEQRKEDLPQPPPTTPTKTQKPASTSSIVTPKAVRTGLAKSPEVAGSKRNLPYGTSDVESGMEKSLNGEDSKNTTKNKAMKSPTSPQTQNSFQQKNLDKNTSRKISSGTLRFPKLAQSPTPQEATSISETHSPITLPKLLEPFT